MIAQELLTAIKSNNQQVIRKLYLENFRRTELFVLKNSGDSEDAKDIYQEAFISTWRNIQMDKFSPKSEGSLASYIFQIARNKWIDHLRSKGFKKMEILGNQDVPDELVGYESDEDTVDYIQLVKKKLQDLGKNCQELLIGFYFKKKSLKLIAEEMEWTEATAKNNKYRCMERLKKLINA